MKRLDYRPVAIQVSVGAVFLVAAVSAFLAERYGYALLVAFSTALPAYFAGYSYGWRSTVNGIFQQRAKKEAA